MIRKIIKNKMMNSFFQLRNSGYLRNQLRFKNIIGHITIQAQADDLTSLFPERRGLITGLLNLLRLLRIDCSPSSSFGPLQYGPCSTTSNGLRKEVETRKKNEEEEI